MLKEAMSIPLDKVNTNSLIRIFYIVIKPLWYRYELLTFYDGPK